MVVALGTNCPSVQAADTSFEMIDDAEIPDWQREDKDEEPAIDEQPERNSRALTIRKSSRTPSSSRVRSLSRALTRLITRSKER